jgi:chromosome segregation ATPase
LELTRVTSNEALRSSQAVASEKIKNVELQYNECERRAHALATTLAMRRDEITSASSKMADLQSQLELKNESLEKAISTCNRLEGINRSLASRITDLESEITSLKEALDISAKEKSELGNVSADLAVARGEIESLHSSIALLKKQVDDERENERALMMERQTQANHHIASQADLENQVTYCNSVDLYI